MPEALAATLDWEVTLNLSHLLKRSETKTGDGFSSDLPHVKPWMALD